MECICELEVPAWLRQKLRWQHQSIMHPASYTFMYAPIICILHPSWQPLYSVWIVIGTTCSLSLLVQETLLSWRHQCLNTQIWAYCSQMKRMVVLAVWVNCVAEALMDPVEIGVAIPVASSMAAVTCRITRRRNCQRTDDRSLTVLTAITPPLPSLHLIPNVLHYSCVRTPQQ